MKNIKAIYMDSEGTLKTNNEIEDDTINIISNLEKEKIPVIITTGLPRFISKNIAKKANALSYLISSNGADIYNLKDNKSIKNFYLNKKLLNDIYEENKNDFNFIFGVGEFEYSNSINIYNMNAHFINNFSDIKEDIFQCHISQKNVSDIKLLFKEKDIIDNYLFYKKILDEQLFDKLLKFDDNILTKNEMKIISRAISFKKLLDLKNKIIKYKEYISLGNQSLDFTNFQYCGEIPWFSFNSNGVNKGNAIKIMCDYLKIDPSCTIAIGNDYNDKSMINVVGKFYCPSDARDFIKEKTNNVYINNVGKVLRKVYGER